MTTATAIDLAREVAHAHGAGSLPRPITSTCFSSGGLPSPRKDKRTHWRMSRRA